MNRIARRYPSRGADIIQKGRVEYDIKQKGEWEENVEGEGTKLLSRKFEEP